MNKSKKNLIAFLVAVAVLGGLAGVYLWQNNRQLAAEAEAEPTPTTAPLPALIDRDEADIESIVFTAGERRLTLLPQRTPNAEDAEVIDTTWVLADEPDVVLNQTTAKDMARGLHYLSAVEVLAETVDNPAEFGLNPAEATAVATYTDGTTATVHIGKMTPARDRYYMMLEGDPALYLLYTYYGDRYFNGANELIDKTVTMIESSTVMEHILIAERGKTPIEFVFDGTEEEKTEMYEAYGSLVLKMKQPYPGRDLYNTNFDTNVLEGFLGFELGELVDISPDDLSEYGLDDPSLELRLASPESAIHLFFGDQTDDGQIYCMRADSPQVFLTGYEHVRSLYGVNVFSFIDKFVALVDIQKCTAIDIAAPNQADRNYRIVIDHEKDEEDFDVVVPFVNGQSVQEQAFKVFYRYLIGIMYDTEIDAIEPAGTPEYTVTYHVSDGDPIVLRYYSYDTHFYAVQYNDEPVRYVTSKQSMEMMLQSLPELLAGNLDSN